MFQSLILAIAFIFGLIVGSFLNCVIFRLKTGESFLKGRSHCPYCKHLLAWYDLIPVLSFMALKGKCRYCRKSISYQYPAVEVGTGLLFLLIFSFQFSISNQFLFFNFQLLNLVYYLLIACFLIVIFVYDLKYFIIPDKVLYPAIATSLTFRLIEGAFRPSIFGFRISDFGFFNFLFTALGASCFFLFIYLISKGRWLGFGDVKLGILLGLFLGWPKILPALFLSFIIGAIIGIGLIIFDKKKLKSEVPFAPFLIIGTLIAFFWGTHIINWYFSLIF